MFCRSISIMYKVLRTKRCAVISSCNNVSSAIPKEKVNLNLTLSYNRDIDNGGVVPVFKRALLFPSRVAVQDHVGIYTYAGLYEAATDLSKEIAKQLCGETNKTIAYMCGNDSSHVVGQWAIWMSGNIAVPLTPLHPEEMLKYYIKDSEAKLLIASQEFENKLGSISSEFSMSLIVCASGKITTAEMCSTDYNKDKLADNGQHNSWYGKNDALIIYTSGTTSKPKGVVWTHSMLQTQISSLHSAWQYSANDVVLHTLPLHHIHGQLNSLNASLAAGSRLKMLPSFAPHAVWNSLLSIQDKGDSKVTVFHGVPSMYARLITAYEKMFASERTENYVHNTLDGRMRLMCAGSAPLPETLANKWFEITGVRLLERYGMTEAGMALSNPYTPVEERAVAHVGLPLPGISARIAATKNEGSDELLPLVTVEATPPESRVSLQKLDIVKGDDDYDYEWKKPKVTVHNKSENDVYEGELLLKGAGIFKRYLNRTPEFNAKDFTSDGWFRTGDTASFSDSKFKILGRTSVDVIKSSGYKISALQIEAVLLENPSVEDVAVIGVEDKDLGEKVVAVVVPKNNAKLSLKDIRTLAGKKLAPYQLPKNLLVIQEMPRNVMGKLDKKVIKQLYKNKVKSGGSVV